MIKLIRSSHNPIISPRKDVWWEKNSVLNPGAVYDGESVHLLYRAMGGDRVSRFGYAHSRDGINFSGFKDFPVFESDPADLDERLGCEDPRVTKIENEYFITYTAASLHPATYPAARFSTSAAPFKVRVSLLSTRDFNTFERHGVIIPDVDSKDAALFPEKVNGQYVILHRIHPDIWIAFSKDLHNWYDHKILMKLRKKEWDSFKIGAGAPPIKTELGWLLFYHGLNREKLYCLGLALLDLSDPTKLIYRSEKPILKPERNYEKEGFVNNVVFTCGAIEKDQKYYIYYGAADRCIGVATIAQDELFREIVKGMK